MSALRGRALGAWFSGGWGACVAAGGKIVACGELINSFWALLGG